MPAPVIDRKHRRWCGGRDETASGSGVRGECGRAAGHRVRAGCRRWRAPGAAARVCQGSAPGAGLWGRAVEVPGLGGPEHWRARQGHLGVVRLGGRLRGRRVLPGPPRPSAGVRGRRAARGLGQGDRGARPGCPEHGRGRRGHLGVVRLGGQLRGRRVLPVPLLSCQTGVRGCRAARGLGPGDRGARPGGPERGRVRRGQLGVVRLGGQLRGRRELLRRQRHAGVRGRRAGRGLGPGGRGARPGSAERQRGRRRGRLGVVRLGGQLRGRRGLQRQPR